jgi:hypothetical protein
VGREKPYAKLSAAAKEAVALDRLREPAVTCPRCETQTTTADLVNHLEERCTGHREVHPASRWIRWRDAVKWIPHPTLRRLASRGLIRRRGPAWRREYLLRDVTRQVAARKAR